MTLYAPNPLAVISHGLYSNVAAAVQTAKPGTWSLADHGDGQTWALTVAGTWADATEFLLQDMDAMDGSGASVLKGNMLCKGLVVGHNYFLQACEPTKTLSDVADAYHTAPSITANYSAGAGNILTGSGDRVDGSVTAGDTSNLVAANAKFQSLETTRNTVVTPLSAVPSPANGGPAAWTQLGDAMVGTGGAILNIAARYALVGPEDAAGDEKARFKAGDTAYFDGYIMLNQALVDARITVEFYPIGGSAVVVADAVYYTFAKDTLVTLATINGGNRPSQALTAYPVGTYHIDLNIAHASLPGGHIFGTSEFTVSDEPATTAVAADDTTGDVTGGIALDQILVPRGTAVSGAPSAAFDVRLNAAVGAVGEVRTVTGGITLDQTVTGVTVTLRRYKKSDGSLVATVVNTTADFVATVQKSWAAILGAACTFTPTIAQEEYLVATVSGGTPTVTSETSGRFGYAVRPGKPAHSANPTAGNGKLTLHCAAAAETDVLYARWRISGGAWSALSETFKRTGSGDLDITGLTNGVYYEAELVPYAGSSYGLASDPEGEIPTDGSDAQIDLLQAAAVARLNAMGLTVKTEAGASVAVTAAKQVPPLFESVNTPCIKVFPDTEEAAADHNELNEIRYRITMAFCQRSKATVQETADMLIRERIRDAFLGKRLLGAYCEKETESGVLDMDALWERFQHVSPITFEFVALRAHG